MPPHEFLSPIITFLFCFSRTEEQTDTAKSNGIPSDRDSENFRSAEGCLWTSMIHTHSGNKTWLQGDENLVLFRTWIFKTNHIFPVWTSQVPTVKSDQSISPLILRQERKYDDSYKHFYMIYYDSHHRGYLWSKRLGFELGYLPSIMTTWAWKAWILALLCCHSRTYILLIHISSRLSF